MDELTAIFADMDLPSPKADIETDDYNFTS